MANPYTAVPIIGYNVNPPSDDGSSTEANRVKWATIKDKLNDPVKVRTDTINTNVAEAFGKVDGPVSDQSISYTILATDQGKLIRATASGITLTTPDATDVGSPFVFAVLNDSDGDITLDGSGTQTIDNNDTIAIPSGCGFRVRTDGSNWFTEGRNFQRPLLAPQGYLTVVSVATEPTTPFPSSDQTSKTAVYYRPDKGNLVPIPNGTTFATREFSELTLTLVSNHVANGIYDVFLFDNDGAITIGTGPVWNTVTAGSGARGTGAGTTELDLLKGLLVNKNAVTMRNGSNTYSVAALSGVYVGSILIDASAGQVTCHTSYGQSRKWGVWNHYNRRKIKVRAGDSTSNWILGSTGSTIRASNNDANNKATAFLGVPDGLVEAEFLQFLQSTSNNTSCLGTIGIGVNSTTATTGFLGENQGATNSAGRSSTVSTTAKATTTISGLLGISNLQMVETAPSGNVTFNGGSQNMLLSVEWMG